METTKCAVFARQTLAFVRSFVRSSATRARRRLTTDEWMDAWIDRGGLPHTFALASSRARARRSHGLRRDRHRPPAYFQSLKSLDMARERRETSPSATGGAIDGDILPGVPVRAREQSPRKSVREANRGAVQRYRDRQRARAGALERECARLRETNARLEGELAHARWVLEEVRRRYALEESVRTRQVGSGGGWPTFTIAHGSGCPLGERETARGGPFGSVANAFANANGRGSARGRGDARGEEERDGEDGAMKGKRRKRRRGGGDVDDEDDLAEFLNTFLVHDDACPCPGHSHADSHE